MTADKAASKQVLLCFDGSADAVTAIAAAGELLHTRAATVVTVWEPVAMWAPYDPGSALTSGLSRLAATELGLDEIASEGAQSTVERGVELARQAGFEATGRVGDGKAWRSICDCADEIDAAPIVLGARGLSRVQSALLGSVSAAVLAHTTRAVLVIPHQ